MAVSSVGVLSCLLGCFPFLLWWHTFLCWVASSSRLLRGCAFCSFGGFILNVRFFFFLSISVNFLWLFLVCCSRWIICFYSSYLAALSFDFRIEFKMKANYFGWSFERIIFMSLSTARTFSSNKVPFPIKHCWYFFRNLGAILRHHVALLYPLENLKKLSLTVLWNSVELLLEIPM